MFSFHGATYIINIWLFQVSSMFSKHSPNTFPSQQMHIHAHNSFQILSLVIFSSLQNSPPELFVPCRDCQPCISVSFLKTILRGHHHPSIEFKTIWLTGSRFNQMWGQYISHPPSIWKHNPPQSWRLGSSTLSKWKHTFVTDAWRCEFYQTKKIQGTQNILSAVEVWQSVVWCWLNPRRLCQVRHGSQDFPSVFLTSPSMFAMPHVTIKVKKKQAEMPLHTQLL